MTTYVFWMLIVAIALLGLLLAIATRRALTSATNARRVVGDLIHFARDLRLCGSSQEVAQLSAERLTRLTGIRTHVVLDAEANPHSDTQHDIVWNDEQFGIVEFEQPPTLIYGRSCRDSSHEIVNRYVLVVASELARCALNDRQHQTILSLRRLDAERSALIGHVSHELRTPLTAMIGFIETLLRDDIQLSDHQREQLLVAARGGGRRLDRLVHDVLQLNEGHSGSMRLKLQSVRMSELVADALTCVDVPSDRELRVWIESDDEIQADRLRMIDVINHLVSNAVVHGAGEVRIRCARIDERMVLDVSDDGPGLPRRRVEDAFQPFMTLGDFHHTTGLGLPISRAIVEAHGGSLLYLYPIEHLPHAFRVSLPVERHASPEGAKGIAPRIRAA